jgi:hypothetical protein
MSGKGHNNSADKENKNETKDVVDRHRIDRNDTHENVKLNDDEYGPKECFKEKETPCSINFSINLHYFFFFCDILKTFQNQPDSTMVSIVF